MDGTRTANGQFGPGNTAAVKKAKQAPGSTGVIVRAGFVDTGERDAALIGQRKWTTYANAYAFPPVAIATTLRFAIHSGAKWSVNENKAGGRNARRGVEIVQEGLLEATFAEGTTWPEVVGKAGMSWLNGSSLHAFALGRRKDGMVVFTDIAHRPMPTIQKWFRQREGDQTTPIVAVEQRIDDGSTSRISLTECFYIVERMISDDPYGVGMLGLVVERIRRAGKYETLEGSELFSSLGGLPISRVPLEKLEKAVAHLPEAERAAEITRSLTVVEGVLRDRIKTPEKQQFLTLSSKTYDGLDPNTITAIQEWAIEIVKGELQGLAEIRKVITDLTLDVARMLGVEFAFVGGGESAGTYGMHESKVSLFQATLQTGLDRIAARANDQLVRRLIAANGLDPDTAAPRLVPEKVTIAAVLDAVAALEGLSRAGLHPKDPARNIIRERVGLPDEPEEAIQESLMAPRLPVPPAPVLPDDEEDVVDVANETEPPIGDKPAEEAPTKKRRKR